MNKLIAISLTFLIIMSTFGVTAFLADEFDVESKDFIFEDFDTETGVINDAESKDGTLDDAYDDAFELYIDGSKYDTSGDYTTEAGGREYVLDKEKMSGLIVYRKVYFPQDRNWVRYLEILYNPTSSPINVDVEIYSNLGSDSYTRVIMTSSGDKIADKDDYWAVSDDELDNEKDDPSLAHVWDGPGGAKRVDDVSELEDGHGYVEYTWNITVKPGQTVVLMHFGGLAMNNNEAIALAKDLFNYNDARMGYDLQERNLIINWSPARLAKAGQKQLPMHSILKILGINQLMRE